ncbi:hypothetical protein J5N97_008553 [Dioscorea zingiberensis]|uniref:Uncharacterized protein n=1 Tax=Dioscorea zingiberensis TaxID=325984 RepID=A0A9D5HKZ5_9LILI|nr:hypothetical protein J5N97_008553 [Dioscorea zingiberensis]
MKAGKEADADPEKGGDLPRAESHNGDRRKGPEIPAPEVEETHHAYLSMDSILLAERETLRRCTVATVVKMLKSLGGSDKVLAAAARLFEPGLEWTSELYGDGRILIHCPSETIARELERRGEIAFPEFIVQFAPWSFDIDPAEKSSEEIRWITGEGLPTFGRNIDTIARILKPIGDLVHLAVHRPPLIDHFRAMVRIRRGRRFPANIHATILWRKYLVRVAMEHRQTPLPWTPAQTKMGEERTQATDVERWRKGKLPIESVGCDRGISNHGATLEEYGKEVEHATCSGAACNVRRQKGDGVGNVLWVGTPKKKWESNPWVVQMAIRTATWLGGALGNPRMHRRQNLKGARSPRVCDVVTWQPSKDHINNVSISNTEDNENLTLSITDYSKAENTNQNDDEELSDDDYLDPILERQIELEFKALWNSQIEGEESIHSESPNKEPIREESSGNKPISPYFESLPEQPSTNVGDLIRPSTQRQLNDHEGAGKTPDQRESPISEERQKTHPHSPTRSKGHEIIIPGPLSDIDISNYSWRLI